MNKAQQSIFDAVMQLVESKNAGLSKEDWVELCSEIETWFLESRELAEDEMEDDEDDDGEDDEGEDEDDETPE